MENDKWIGEKYNRLTIISYDSDYISPTGWKAKKYKCLCDCGTEKIITLNSVIYNLTKSCGCLHRENGYTQGIKTKYKENNCAHYLYNLYKKDARIKNRDFDIIFEDFIIITSKNCHYCNIEPLQLVKDKRTIKNIPYLYNGIDRLDSSLGYVLNNIVPCCKICNYMKGRLSHKDFLEHINRIYNYKIALIGLNEAKTILNKLINE